MLHMITRSTSPRCFFKRKLFRMFCNSQGLRKLLEVEKSLNHEPPAENKENPSHKTTARHITCRTLWTTVVRHVFVHHWPQNTQKFVQEKLLDRMKMGGVCFSILFQFPSTPKSHYFFVGCEFFGRNQQFVGFGFWIWLWAQGSWWHIYDNKCGIQRHQFLSTLEENYSQT